MGSEVIFYDLRLIAKNDFKIIAFEGGQNILINHFTRKDGSQDYIVIGRIDMDKFKGNNTLAMSFSSLSARWISGLSSYIEKYRRFVLYLMTSAEILLKSIDQTDHDIRSKTITANEGIKKYQRKQINYDSEELSRSQFFNRVEFTKEGYDFISGKFLFMSGIMKRNVTVPTEKSGTNILFSNKYKTLCNGECFLPYSDYKKQPLLTQEESDSMDYDSKIKFYNFYFYELESLFIEFRKRKNHEVFKDSEYIEYNAKSQVDKLQFLIEFSENQMSNKLKGTTR